MCVIQNTQKGKITEHFALQCCVKRGNLRDEFGVPGGVACGVVFGET